MDIQQKDTTIDSGFIERRKSARRKTNGVHSYSRHSHQHRTRLIWVLALISGGMFILTMIVSVKLSLYAKELNEITILQHKQERELAGLRPEVERLREEVSELVMRRLPGLHPLIFDRVITIDKRYVRNIMFTLIGKEEDRQYEYKLTLKNNGLTSVHPIVEILFFDELGIQVASSVIGVDDAGVPTLDVLERGEVRSYTRTIGLAKGRNAKYFMVHVDLPEYQKLKQ